MSDVVDLRTRDPVHYKGNPDRSIVILCEELLERAQSGDIVGVAVCVAHPDGTISTYRRGEGNPSVVGGLFGLMETVSAVWRNR